MHRTGRRIEWAFGLWPGQAYAFRGLPVGRRGRPGLGPVPAGYSASPTVLGTNSSSGVISRALTPWSYAYERNFEMTWRFFSSP